MKQTPIYFQVITSIRQTSIEYKIMIVTISSISSNSTVKSMDFIQITLLFSPLNSID